MEEEGYARSVTYFHIQAEKSADQQEWWKSNRHFGVSGVSHPRYSQVKGLGGGTEYPVEGIDKLSYLR